MKGNQFVTKQVLIFNREKVLISICSSVSNAAKVTMTLRSAISAACIGTSISSGGFYFRYIHPKTIIEIEDLDRLKIDEYDKLCGIKRVYHSRSSMVAHSAKITKRRKSNSD